MSPAAEDTGPEQNPAVRNVDEISKLEREEVAELPRGERISIALTNAAGTWVSALAHLVVFGGWMSWNTVAPRDLRFDPFPFSLLTMIVSMEGVILAVFVLITQNRMSAQSDRRDHLDLQVDLLAEQEMTMVLRMLNRICDHLGVAPDAREHEETQRLMEQTNVYELMEELRRKFK
jgi:uncharacterized membrane protein